MKLFFNVWEDEITFVARAEMRDEETDELLLLGDFHHQIKKGEGFYGVDYDIWKAFGAGMARINFKANKILFT